MTGLKKYTLTTDMPLLMTAVIMKIVITATMITKAVITTIVITEILIRKSVITTIVITEIVIRKAVIRTNVIQRPKRTILHTPSPSKTGFCVASQVSDMIRHSPTLCTFSTPSQNHSKAPQTTSASK